jgi:hypothetical protein
MHGFGFLMDAVLDSYQFDLLMVVSWAILQSKKKMLNEHPSKETVKHLSSQAEFNDLGLYTEDQEELPNDTSPLEEACKRLICCRLLPRTINVKAQHEDLPAGSTVGIHRSLSIHGCLPKHRRKIPIIKGNGNAGAVLSDITADIHLFR